MVAELTAEAFVKALRTGRTCPCLLFCSHPDGGGDVEAVVKLRSGPEASCASLIRELMASLLARDLDLPVPEPYLVRVDPGFHEAVPDGELAGRFQRSVGLNFGCRHLGPAYVSWPKGRSIPASLTQEAAEILAFDLMVQNPDRRKNKPNLLRKDEQLAIFDHEMAFSFLYDLEPDQHPWDGKGMQFAVDHVFYDALKGKAISWTRMQGALAAIGAARIHAYGDAVPTEWKRNSPGTVVRIQDYLGQARDNSDQMFRKITEVLV